MMIESHNKQLVQVSERVHKLEYKISSGISVIAVPTQGPLVEKFKVPPFDGALSWSSYKLLFKAAMMANGQNQEQVRIALALDLRDGAFAVLETLQEQTTFKRLMKALDAGIATITCYMLTVLSLKIRASDKKKML
ncbi:hypothetical protein EVAR_18502_1 [Eumeta japonica]|uniref:Uncharacterized protein n=1 Tax=Eumeta variegata TaxID=151549 RepID=A0A4C1UZN3_EUMVA|nr:hypothetical protein EVAR_18502_1 [Eumeta japonica]